MNPCVVKPDMNDIYMCLLLSIKLTTNMQAVSIHGINK